MAAQNKRALLPPTYAGTPTGGNQVHVREINNPAYVEADGTQDTNKSLPLPDYETLFPQKRHGVQGQTRWDHIIAEVNQRHRDDPVFLGPEVSVDGPVEHEPSPRSSMSQERPAMGHYQTQPQVTKPMSSKKVAAPAPPKPVASPLPLPVAASQRQSQDTTQKSPMKTNPSTVPVSADTSSRGTSRDGGRKVLHPSPAATSELAPQSQMDMDRTSSDDQRKVTTNKEAPTAKPRQRVSQPTQEGNQAKENFADFDPFPSTDLIPKDPWAHLKPNQEVNDSLIGNVQRDQKPEDRGMTVEDLDKIFAQEKPANPFGGFSVSDADKHSLHKKMDDGSKHASPVFRRKNSQRGKKILTPTTHSDEQTFMSQQEPAYKERTSLPTPNESFSTRDASLQADLKTQSDFSEKEDPFGAEPFVVHSALTSSQPLPVVMEEPASQAGSLSGGKTPLRAWVSPSEVQTVSTQNSIGGGLGLTPRR